MEGKSRSSSVIKKKNEYFGSLLQNLIYHARSYECLKIEQFKKLVMPQLKFEFKLM